MNTRASITKLYLGITYVTLIFCANLAFSQSINTIVIDAGHGGKDHGCRGAFTIEKELTLAMAQKIKQTLNQSMPEIQVMLTRESDVFIPLSQRNSLANAIGADLFLSLHCNHIHIESVQGTEAYVLGENTIQEDHSIAERENAAFYLEESITDEAANYILNEAYQKSNLNESIILATLFNNAVAQSTDLKKRNVRQAQFAVLRGAQMPAVLLEVGFISNSHDEAILASDDGQWSIARGIVNAIATYNQETQNVLVVNSANDYIPSTNAPIIPVNSPIVQMQSQVLSQTSTRTQQPVYSVQIAATIDTKANTQRAEWSAVEHYETYHQDKLYKYLVGKFDTLEAAVAAKEKYEQEGFKGAFVVSYDSFKSTEKIN